MSFRTFGDSKIDLRKLVKAEMDFHESSWFVFDNPDMHFERANHFSFEIAMEYICKCGS